MHPSRKESPKRKRKPRWTPSDGARLAKWREANGWTQEELASKVAMSRLSVSGWEVGRRAPDAGVLMRLAFLAKADDSIWFWRKSGVKGNALQHVDSEAKARTEPFVPDELAKREGFTRYFIADELVTGYPFQRGDVLFLDESLNDSASLRPFWDQAVLVEAKTVRGTVQISGLKLLLGRLFLKRSSVAHPGTIVWDVQMQPLSMIERLVAYRVGMYVDDSPLVSLGARPAAATNRAAFEEASRMMEEQSRSRAEEHAALDADFRLRGIVIGWIGLDRRRSLARAASGAGEDASEDTDS